MTANRELAAQRGLSEDTCKKIDKLHEGLNNLLQDWGGEEWMEHRHEIIKAVEYDLQMLWGFEVDEAYHTWTKRYKFKTQWAGRVFRCTVTGITRTIPVTVEEGAFYQVGRGFVDVGRLECYSRFSGVEEVESERKNR